MGNAMLSRIKFENTSNAAAVYNFDEFDSNQALDDSGNGNTADVYGVTGAYLKLEDGTGTATDETNYGLTVTHFNSPVWQANSSPDLEHSSLNFTTSSSQYLTVSDVAQQRPSGDFSVWCWAKITTLGVAYGLFGKAEGLGNKKGYLLYIESTNKFRFAGYNNDGSVNVAEANSAITDNNWHFIVGVYTLSDTTGKIYVDGVLQNDTFVSAITHSTGNMILGRFWNDTTGGSLSGNLSNCGSCARALSQNEITEMYNLRAAKLQDFTLDGKFGRAFVGKGSEYLLLPNDSSLNIIGNLTLEAWVKTNYSAAAQVIIGGYNQAPNYEGYGLLLAGAGQVGFFLSGHGTTIYGNTAVNDNTWHHVVANYNSLTKEIKIYVDGQLDKQTIVTGGPQSWSGQRRIGETAVTGLYGFVGLIDDPRIYDVVLSDEVIEDHYNADVTSAVLNYEIENTYCQQCSVVSIDFSRASYNNLFNVIGVPKQIRIWRGYLTANDEKIFDGNIETVSEEFGKIKINGRDKLGDLVRKNVNHEYLVTDGFAGKVSAILQDLVTTYGGLNADSTTIQDSGTTLILQSFKCINTDIFERCKKLAEALDWQLYYRPDTNKVYFEPKGFKQNNNLIFQTSDKNMTEIPKWTEDKELMCNDLTLTGASQLIETTELKSGNASDVTFTLSYKPESIKVFYAAAVNFSTTAITEQYIKKGGIDNSTINPDYTVDKDGKSITCVTFTPASSTNNLAIQYSAYAPVAIHQTDDPSIQTYTCYAKTIDIEDIKTLADAEIRAAKYIELYKNPFNVCSIKARNIQTDFVRIGQSIRIIDPVNARDEFLVLNRHKIRYPGDYEELTFGDKEWRTEQWMASVEEKLKRLKELDKENTDLVTEIKSISSTLGVKIETCYTEYRDLGYPNTNIFLLGDPNYGVLGTSKLGDNTGITFERNYVYNRNNTFREYFTDTQFRDKIIETYTSSGSTIGLIGWWRLDDNAANTTVLDSSPFSNDGTAQQNTNVITTTGKLGTAFTFDGSVDYIDLDSYKTDDLFNVAQGTISFWIYPDSTMVGTYCAIMNYRKVSTTDYLIIRYIRSAGGGHTNAQSIAIIGKVSGATTLFLESPALSVPVDTWSHISIVQNGSTISVYINGLSVVVSGTNSSHWFSSVYPANQDFRIGAPGSWTYFMDGKLDEFMIWNRALTSDEALQLGTSKHESGVWDTTNKKIDLIANQSYTSSIIAYNSGTNISSLTVYANTSGSLNWFVRTDTNSWESLTLGTLKTLSNPGEKLQIRATESAGSTATINAQIRVIYN